MICGSCDAGANLQLHARKASTHEACAPLSASHVLSTSPCIESSCKRFRSIATSFCTCSSCNLCCFSQQGLSRHDVAALQACKRVSLDNSSLEKVGPRGHSHSHAASSAAAAAALSPPPPPPLSCVAENTSSSEMSTSNGNASGRTSTDSGRSQTSSDRRRERLGSPPSLHLQTGSVSSHSSGQPAASLAGAPPPARAGAVSRVTAANVAGVGGPGGREPQSPVPLAEWAGLSVEQAQAQSQRAAARGCTADADVELQANACIAEESALDSKEETLPAAPCSFNPYPAGKPLSRCTSFGCASADAASEQALSPLRPCSRASLLQPAASQGLTAPGGEAANCAAEPHGPGAAPARGVRRSLSVSDMAQVPFRTAAAGSDGGDGSGVAALRSSAGSYDELAEAAAGLSHGHSKQAVALQSPLKDVPALRVLIAEDNKVNQLVVRKVLRSVMPGCEVDVAADGQAAVRAIQTQPAFDLVLMDLHMPGMDGFEATQAIRERHPRKPLIVALTADTIVGVVERCKSSGMDEYISKPFRMADMQRLLQRVHEAAGAA